ncbi:hypothetical protein GGX14DRAFT_365173, partial [Mycena pura]
HTIQFPILSRILCIPGVSISVERLCKHTMSDRRDSRSSMQALTAAATIMLKELLKAGFGASEGLDYLECVTIR